MSCVPFSLTGQALGRGGGGGAVQSRHCSAQRSAAQRSTAQRSAAQRSAAQHPPLAGVLATGAQVGAAPLARHLRVAQHLLLCLAAAAGLVHLSAQAAAGAIIRKLVPCTHTPRPSNTSRISTAHSTLPTPSHCFRATDPPAVPSPPITCPSPSYPPAPCTWWCRRRGGTCPGRSARRRTAACRTSRGRWAPCRRRPGLWGAGQSGGGGMGAAPWALG